MSGWQKGDLAVCIKRGEWCHYGTGEPTNGGPKYNEIVTVRRVGIGISGMPVLWLVGYKGDEVGDSFGSRRFRKIKPDTEGANEDDAAWLKDLLAKPKVQVLP